MTQLEPGEFAFRVAQAALSEPADWDEHSDSTKRVWRDVEAACVAKGRAMAKGKTLQREPLVLYEEDAPPKDGQVRMRKDGRIVWADPPAEAPAYSHPAYSHPAITLAIEALVSEGYTVTPPESAWEREGETVTASKLPPERRDELARVAGRTSFNSHGDGFAIVDALHAELAGPLEAERDSHKAMLRMLHGHVADMCERLGVDPEEVPADSWTLRDRIVAIIAERDALQKRLHELLGCLSDESESLSAVYAERDALKKRLAELERPAPAQEPSATDPRHPAWWTCKQFQARFETERARAAHNEACAKWVLEHGRAAVQATANKTESWGDMLAQEAAVDALRALLKDEET